MTYLPSAAQNHVNNSPLPLWQILKVVIWGRQSGHAWVPKVGMLGQSGHAWVPKVASVHGCPS
jgi:hypothetical protein